MRRDGVITLTAEADVEAHRLVRMGVKDYHVVHASSTQHSIIGITDTAAKAGEPVDIIHDGVAKVEMGRTLTTPGHMIFPDAVGRGTTGTYTHRAHSGISMQIVGAIGDVIDVLLD